ncbi:hypothetical protein SEA_NICEHOUSE_203 [Rhodococcus phage NiceHouse]|nr:hypothetical protein SEA_NICEHOUSE_203 [Rhodococcus phage NiceHouse]
MSKYVWYLIAALIGFLFLGGLGGIIAGLLSWYVIELLIERNKSKNERR